MRVPLTWAASLARQAKVCELTSSKTLREFRSFLLSHNCCQYILDALQYIEQTDSVAVHLNKWESPRAAASLEACKPFLRAAPGC